MLKRAGLIGAACLAVVATPALAEPYYFHKAGVDRERFVEDVVICRELAGTGRAPTSVVPYSPNLYATMVTALVSGFLNSRERRQHQQAIERICMADKGYARVAIPKDEFKRIRALEEDLERMDALFALASASTRQGEELPE